MGEFVYTLLADGGSDRCLLSIIDSVLRDLLAGREVVSQFEHRSHHGHQGLILAQSITRTLGQFPCDLLVVHRDAEKVDPDHRIREILTAAEAVVASPEPVPVVPVRMTEAWLLYDERAIRKAAGNPHGTVPLPLPPHPEKLPDPKHTLRELLTVASERQGRRRKEFRGTLPERIHRVADNLPGIEPLRGLAAFRRFEADLGAAVVGVG